MGLNKKIAPGSLVVVTKKSKRAVDLWMAYKKISPMIRCSCGSVRGGIFVVDDVIGDVVLMTLRNGFKVVVAPITDVEMAVE
jgi:hypothetical protein